MLFRVDAVNVLKFSEINIIYSSYFITFDMFIK